MALHVKSTRTFKLLIIFSALLVSGMAATFSVTGIATLFSGYFLTVAIMMGALEFSKIVVASFLSRFWKDVSWTLKSYFIIALIVLVGITSGGIFGYLSDAYQQTKGDYTLIEKETSLLESKKQAFVDRKDRLLSDKELEVSFKQSNQTRVDSLTARGQGISRTRSDILVSEEKIKELEIQISATEDSIGYYDMRIVELESKNIKGELGPLKYIADAFGTDMDTIVKYFIFLLIFVFDPLAILLFVSVNMIIRKETIEKTNNIVDKMKSFSYKKYLDDNNISNEIQDHGELKEEEENIEKEDPTLLVDFDDEELEKEKEEFDEQFIDDLFEEEEFPTEKDKSEEYVKDLLNSFDEKENKNDVEKKEENVDIFDNIEKHSANFRPSIRK